MKSLFQKTAVLVCLAVPVQAESFMDKVRKGTENAADAIGKGADKVGDAVGKGADSVQNSIQSTNELLRDEGTPAQTRDKLDRMADDVLARLLAENTEARRAYAISAGIAVFDMPRVSVFPLSAGYGRGVAVSLTGDRTYMQMGTGGVGAAFGIGGFESQFVIMFETPVDFQRFVDNGYDASAAAGTMQGRERSGDSVQFTDGRSFFVLSKTGWRINANANGTKYWKDADLN